MPFNLSGTLAVFHALVRPGLIFPNLIVQGAPLYFAFSFFLFFDGLCKDIRSLNFAAFKQAGFQGVILDKDNCLVSSLKWIHHPT